MELLTIFGYNWYDQSTKTEMFNNIKMKDIIKKQLAPVWITYFNDKEQEEIK